MYSSKAPGIFEAVAYVKTMDVICLNGEDSYKEFKSHSNKQDNTRQSVQSERLFWSVVKDNHKNQ